MIRMCKDVFPSIFCLVTLGVGLLVLVSGVSHADNTRLGISPNIPEKNALPLLTLPDMSRMSDKDADQAAIQVFDHLDAIRKSVFVQLQTPHLSDSTKAHLYRLAGELQVYDAMDMMINDIQFSYSQKGSLPPTAVQPPDAGGPVAQTMLAAFGLPAVREILAVMSDQKQDVPFVAANTNNYAWVLWAVEGKRCVLVRLEAQLAKEKSPKVRSQYQRVIDRLKVFPDQD